MKIASQDCPASSVGIAAAL